MDRLFVILFKPSLGFVVLCQILVECRRHICYSSCGCFEVEAQANVAYAVGGNVAEAGNELVALNIVGHILLERLETVGAEEDEHIVRLDVVGRYLGAHSAVHLGLRVSDAVRVENVVELVVVHVRHRYKVLLTLVLYKEWLKVFYMSVTEEYFALAVLYVLLNIKRDGF